MFDIVLDSQVTVGNVFVTLFIAFILGLAVSFVYQRTSRDTSYSSSFVTSLILLNMITSVVMLTIGSNLARAFGLVGALSIIRFRTAIKDPKDISFIFLSLILGMASGTMNYHIAVIAGFTILLVIYILDQTKHGVFVSNKYFLTVDVDPKKFDQENFNSIVEQFTREQSLVSLNPVYNDPKLTRRVYKLVVMHAGEDELVEHIKKMKSVKNISVISSENYIQH